jgi:hypothetical protein
MPQPPDLGITCIDRAAPIDAALPLPRHSEPTREASGAPARRRPVGAWAAAMAAAALAGLAGAPVLARGTQAPGDEAAPPASVQAAGCDQATKAATAACARQAQADNFLALGICANLKDAAQREKCIGQAESELKSAQGECKDQEEARQKVCQTLGQAPYDPAIRPSDFVGAITNPYFPLKPGTVFVYQGKDVTDTVTVLPRTVTILGVRCVVVRDTNVVNGAIEEDTFDYYAQDKLGNVWYFGEASAEYANGVPVSTEGSWLAGVDGAKPGIIMPATPRPGATYRQEFALGEAEDLARVESLGERVQVPYGTFTNALKTFEVTPLEPDAKENKYYAPGVGQVLVVDLETGAREELVSVKRQ